MHASHSVTRRAIDEDRAEPNLVFEEHGLPSGQDTTIIPFAGNGFEGPP